MKTLLITLSLAFAGTAMAQLAPQASPAAKIEQRVGLTDLTVKYSRPGKKDRVIFGELLPYGEVWRTGANENTTFTCSDVLIFGKDTLKAGSYALYTIPNKDKWELIFYATTTNWGTPETWEESKVVLKTSSPVTTTKMVTESFTINITDLKSSGASINMMWDQTSVSFPFTVTTDAKVMANINKVMAGPSANDYYASANYYYTEGKDLNKAAEWCKKAMEANPEAFWIQLLMAKIQVKQGLKKEAVATAQSGKAIAEKTKYDDYVKEFETIIKENSK
jgi:hypothetical protein